jgi:hypothetical protein
MFNISTLSIIKYLISPFIIPVRTKKIFIIVFLISIIFLDILVFDTYTRGKSTGRRA